MQNIAQASNPAPGPLNPARLDNIVDPPALLDLKVLQHR
jgi:hypothetical protein